MRKVRLDMLVNPETKKLLFQRARNVGVSASTYVEALILLDSGRLSDDYKDSGSVLKTQMNMLRVIGDYKEVVTNG